MNCIEKYCPRTGWQKPPKTWVCGQSVSQPRFKPGTRKIQVTQHVYSYCPFVLEYQMTWKCNWKKIQVLKLLQTATWIEMDFSFTLYSNKIALGGNIAAALLCYSTTGHSGPGSSVGIATGYGLDGSGSNPGGGEIFRTCPDRPWGPPSLQYNGYRGLSRW